ncbi:MAG: isochorismate synthase [Candidatus Kariarchaeaceae archaeon]|jgi:menaquinone-specific isochorismate synthase
MSVIYKRYKDVVDLHSDIFQILIAPSEELVLQNYTDQGAFPRYFLRTDSETVLGIGEVRRSTNSPLELLSELGKTQIFDPENTQVAPRILGGISFDGGSDPMWNGFDNGWFILPRVSVIMGTKPVVIFAGLHLAEAILQYEDLIPEPVKEEAVEITEQSYPVSKEAWIETIGRAHQEMSSGNLEKVVLSRIVELRTQRRVNFASILDYLEKSYQGTYRFLVQIAEGVGFYGASPELLVRSTPDTLSSVALAGTITRSDDPEEDAKLAQTLLSDPKELLEHKLVVDMITERLSQLSDTIEVDIKPKILKLSNVQHLLTEISLPRVDHNPMDIVELLHPTPALGGKPRMAALEFIKEHEKRYRGWYGSPLGWIDMEMNAEFCVAIRSAISRDKTTWLYAGAGIVPDSMATREWDEIELKFKPMLGALGVRK